MKRMVKSLGFEIVAFFKKSYNKSWDFEQILLKKSIKSYRIFIENIKVFGESDKKYQNQKLTRHISHQQKQPKSIGSNPFKAKKKYQIFKK